LDIKRVSAIYCLVVGISMIGMWTFFIVSGSVPELEDRPAEITLHLVAEFSTALCLLMAGSGLLRRKDWGTPVYLLASGLLTYTLIVSPGYYITHEEPALVVMFAVFLALDLIILAMFLRDMLHISD